MSLAVGQAILACLKCGWDPVEGTNILRPSLCNDQDQGSVSGFYTERISPVVPPPQRGKEACYSFNKSNIRRVFEGIL